MSQVLFYPSNGTGKPKNERPVTKAEALEIYDRYCAEALPEYKSQDEELEACCFILERSADDGLEIFVRLEGPGAYIHLTGTEEKKGLFGTKRRKVHFNIPDAPDPTIRQFIESWFDMPPDDFRDHFKSMGGEAFM